MSPRTVDASASPSLFAVAADQLKSSALGVLERNLVLAALRDVDHVQAVLDGRISEVTQHAGGASGADTRLFLSSITVQGFRGIGPALTIEFDCRPGLTVIQGANGSGKSSIAEGLELLLTNGLKRWDVKSRKDWREGWRNLHHSGDALVEARFIETDSVGTIVRRRMWPSDATSIDQGKTEFEQPGNVGFASLAWNEAFQTWKPFMSPAEVQNLIDQPADAYDVMRSTLGLDPLSEAQKRLADSRKPLQDQSKRLGQDKSEIVKRLQASDDDRAIFCLNALQSSPEDLDALRRVVSGQRADEPDSIAVLRSLSALPVPDAGEVADRLAELATARLANAELVGTDLERERTTLELLERALAFHADHGDRDCPVCGGAQLDSAWKTNTETAVADLRERTRAVEDARNAFADAVRTALALGQFADAISMATVPTGIDGRRFETARSAWLDRPSQADGEASAAHLEMTIGELLEAAGDIQSAASQRLETVDANWLPTAQNLRAWLTDAEKSLDDKPKIKALRAAEQWLKGFANDLLVDRFEPIGADVKETFRQLKGLSNIDLLLPELSGSGNRRELDLPALIAGADQPKTARALMSQGELTALGLSLFLPRLKQPACPIGFGVVDDPLQSMDRSKIDGFARVLAVASESRQLIVFTHDARLAEAVQRLRIGATVIEMRRARDSEVLAERIADATTRYLKDARSLLESGNLPSEARWRTAPNMLRSAIEAAAAATVMRTRVAQGMPHAEVERLFAEAITTRDKLAQAFGVDKKKKGDLNKALCQLDDDLPDVIDSLNDLSHPRRAEPATVKSLFLPTEALIAGLQQIS